jgi:glycosyltransferase involved in cell wall biosynthesis
VAIITPWFGENLVGGAELLAWELAFGLRDRIERVSVLTTCAASFHSPWNVDAHPPGEYEIDGVRIVRFPVDRNDPQRFTEINRKLLAAPRERLKAGAPLLEERELNDFLHHNINSTKLLSHLARNEDAFDALVFMPYLYGLVLRGWRIAPQRTAVIPLLHDEVYAYLPPAAALFRGAGMLLFTTPGSLELGRRLYGPGILPRSRVVGCGIRWPAAVAESQQLPIQGFTPESRRYVMYLGRRSEEKNVDLLLAAFARYREYVPKSDLELVLVGPDRPALRTADHVTLLNGVSEEQKSRLLRGCLALAQPSTNESFSRAMMEAWAVHRPVAVHADCIATAEAVDATGAGWKAGDVVDWVNVLARIDASSPIELEIMGRRADSYVHALAAWPRVLDACERALRDLAATVGRTPATGHRIVHFVDNAVYADSTAALALANDSLLRRNGFSSAVVARRRDSRLGTLVADVTDVRDGDIRIDYLHGDEPTEGGLRIITGYGVPLVRHPDGRTEPFPVFVDSFGWNIEPTADVMTPLQDGRTNILAIGEIAPHNRQVDIALIFRWYYTFDFDARLLLVGKVGDEAYLEKLRAAIREMGLEHRILVTGEVSKPALAAMYQTAHLFVTLRPHYDTGLSLLEAMAFDLPICAVACPQSRQILRSAGLLISDEAEPLAVAALWKILVSDAETRAAVIAAQRERLAESTESNALKLLTSAAANGRPL